jgi:hypothetical protein
MVKLLFPSDRVFIMMEARDLSVEEENRRIRRFRMLVDLTSNVICQDPSLKHREARKMVFDLRRVASNWFPGKEGTFDMVLWPRFDRALKERYGVGMDLSVH